MKHNAILNCICSFAIFICTASEQVVETEQQDDEMQVSTSSRKSVAYATTPRDMSSRRRNLGSNDNLAWALQQCIDGCDSLGFCCGNGNRINGEAGEQYCILHLSSQTISFITAYTCTYSLLRCIFFFQ